MDKFKSLVVLDLETTSLMHPRITEISMIAVEAQHLLDSHTPPRVTHKLSLCVNPLGKIHPVTTALTGLDNELLMNVDPVNENFIDCVISFLSHIPGPVCLVAHNGFTFDFPILKKEIINRTQSVTMRNIFVVDSLHAFKEILGRKRPYQDHPQHPQELMCSEEDNICIMAMQQYEQSLTENPVSSQMDIEEHDSSPVTPPRTPPQIHEDLADILLQAPKKIKKQRVYPSGLSARRSLFPGVNKNVTTSPDQRIKPKSFKLQDLYEFLTKKTMIDAHRAENDCWALLECIMKTNTYFIEYAQRNAILLSDTDHY